MPAFQLVILVTPLTGALELIASLRAKYTDGTAMCVNEIHNSVHQYQARILC